MKEITATEWALQIAPLLDPRNGWGPQWAGPLREAWEAWNYDGETLDDMLRLMLYAEIPLRQTSLFHDWRDPTNPLGSLLEVIAGAKTAGLHGIYPSVIAAQFLHEAGKKPDRKAPLGIKASRKDLEAGTWIELATLEVLSPAAVMRLQQAGKLLEVLRATRDGRQEIRCLQKFHYEPGLRDDLELIVGIYERYFNDHGKPRPEPGWTPEDFLRKVTQAPPAYATGEGYPESCLKYIEDYHLEALDTALERVA